MRRSLVIAAVLSLVATAVLADMYQDASNAKKPEARNNLEIGTVKLEGGTPPNLDAVTRFYNFSGKKQFEIGTSQYAAETVLEQSGLPPPAGATVGQGPTRICLTSLGGAPQVNCNYVAFGAGLHRFANGGGYMAEIESQGTGSMNARLKLIAADDGIARLWAIGSAGANMELKANGNGVVTVNNATGGKIASFFNINSGPNDRYLRLISGDAAASPQISAFSDTAADVNMRLRAKGAGAVSVVNDNSTISFTPQNGTTPAQIGSGSIEITGHRPVMSSQTTTNVTVTVADSGTHFDNVGATAAVNFNLPPAVRGLQYCFTRDAAFNVVVKADAADKIAMGATNSVLGGTAASNLAFASMCIEAHKAGQWITRSTPDKTQWTVT